MNIIRILITAAVISMLSACGLFPDRENLKPGADFDSADPGAIVVLGVDPAYQVGVQAMHVLSPTTFEQEATGGMAFVIFPEDGYIVAKVKPLKKDERYIIYQIAPQGISASNAISGEGVFFACEGANAPTFDVEPGQVSYLGDIHFQVTGNNLTITHGFNPDAAREFLRNKYPKLADKIVPGNMTEMKIIGKPCSVHFTIFIRV